MAEAFRSCRHAVIEAGTGVGKTLAYLVPAILAALAGKRTVITTHTISLQQQLATKDIPLALSLFPAGKNVPYAVMKGRGNYLCLQDLDYQAADVFAATDPIFRQVRKWAAGTKTGDVADLDVSYPEWQDVAANQDTCGGKECRFHESCFYYKAKGRAKDARILIVNHALFLSDLVMRQEQSEGAILPEYDFVVVDEAHHFEDVATKTFGVELGSRMIHRLTERAKRLPADIDKTRLDTVEKLNAQFFGPFLSEAAAVSGSQDDRAQEFFIEDVLGEDLSSWQDTAERLAISTEGLQTFLDDVARKSKDDDPRTAERSKGLAKRCARIREAITALAFAQDLNVILWCQTAEGSRSARAMSGSGIRATLHATPIHVGHLMDDLLWSKVKSVVMLSATVANSGGFSYVRGRLNLPDNAIERIVSSPFNYREKAMLYVPAHLKAPPRQRDPEYAEALSDEIARMVEITGGRAFLLFTSKRALNEVYNLLFGRLDFPFFRQGDQPSGKLLQAFRDSGNGVLFGTSSFWEGVDVQGQALSLVVIDRIPFGVPDHPVTKARTRAIEEAGGNWFAEYSLPIAQVKLKQGFGRLIRTSEDQGIVCILDPRLLTKGYGPEFVRYLPPAARASVRSRVKRFWDGLSACGLSTPAPTVDTVAHAVTRERSHRVLSVEQLMEVF